MASLHFACQAGNAPAAFALLKAGAHPGAADGVGRTPLHWAALAGSAVLVRKLLRRSQGGPALLNLQDGSGYSALMVASEHGREEIVRLLLSYEGCNAVLRNKRVMAVWALLIVGLTAIGFLTALLGLAVTIPVLGHATWHAYRDTIDASAWPANDAQ